MANCYKKLYDELNNSKISQVSNVMKYYHNQNVFENASTVCSHLQMSEQGVSILVCYIERHLCYSPLCHESTGSGKSENPSGVFCVLMCITYKQTRLIFPARSTLLANDRKFLKWIRFWQSMFDAPTSKNVSVGKEQSKLDRSQVQCFLEGQRELCSLRLRSEARLQAESLI